MGVVAMLTQCNINAELTLRNMEDGQSPLCPWQCLETSTCSLFDCVFCTIQHWYVGGKRQTRLRHWSPGAPYSHYQSASEDYSWCAYGWFLIIVCSEAFYCCQSFNDPNIPFYTSMCGHNPQYKHYPVFLFPLGGNLCICPLGGHWNDSGNENSFGKFIRAFCLLKKGGFLWEQSFFIQQGWGGAGSETNKFLNSRKVSSRI